MLRTCIIFFLLNFDKLMPYPSHLPVYNTVSTVLDYKSLLPWPDKTRSDLERGPGRFFAGP